MKTFRIFSIAVLGIILAACSSNDEIIEQPAQPNDDVIHFSGTISLEGAGTRTAMTETEADQTITADWQVNDKINMCQNGSCFGTALVTSLSGSSATIEGTLSSGCDLSANFDLKYLGNSEGANFNTVLQDRYMNQRGTVGNLGTYDWREGSAKLKLDGSNYVIDGTVKLEAKMAVWKLTLTDGTNPLNMSNTGKTLKVFYDGVQVAGSKANFSGGSTNIVYLAVPTASSKTIRIEYNDGSNTYFYQKSGVSIAASKYYQSTVTLSRMISGSSAITGGGSQEWVQLWAGGPKWAKFNVGSTITSYAGVTEYSLATVGGHYSYRGITDNSADAGAVDDTAKYFWGANWATPTKDQLQALLDNCTWTLCDGSTVQYETGCTLVGYKLSGKETGYMGNSIFLPYAGINDQNHYGLQGTAGYRGVFWSLTSGGYGAYYLNEGQYGQSVMDHNQPHGCSVRAICVE